MRKAAGTIAGAAVVGALAKHGIEKTQDKLDSLLSSPGETLTGDESKRLVKKLEEHARESGLRVYRIKGTNAGNAPDQPGIRRLITKGVMMFPKESREQLVSSLAEGGYTNGMRIPLGLFGRKGIILGDKVQNASTLAHELGHAHYHDKGSNKIIRDAHKVYPIGNHATMTKAGIIASGAHGFASGVKNAKKDTKGEKRSAWSKVRSVAVPLALTAPVLVSEAAASAKGLKTPKELGASKKKLLKTAKKDLTVAFGTYAVSSSAPVIAGAVGEMAGGATGRVLFMMKGENRKMK